MSEDDRVLGFVLGSRAVAVPLRILRHHEIVNFDQLEPPVAVTYCPLTGSGLVFDRTDAGNATFGVSGLLWRNNLIMYDRRSDESLWPQMDRAARCGPADGVLLASIPALEITWKGWTALYPATGVVSSETGYSRDYGTNPYGNYGDVGNTTLLYDMTVDPRLPMKERVLGLPSGEGGVAVPFRRLDDGAPVRVVHLDAFSQVVVFWDGEHEAAMAYEVPPDVRDGGFAVREGQIVDLATGSVWRVDGRSVSGAHEGMRLHAYRDAYVAFWFAWAAFQPRTTIWGDDA